MRGSNLNWELLYGVKREAGAKKSTAGCHTIEVLYFYW
jgi:hypothetical protein